MDDRALLLTHMEDLVRKAQKTGMAHSKFLTPSEVACVETAYGARKDIHLVLDGGFAGAERRIAVFTQADWGSYQPDEVLAGVVLRHRAQDALRHQDVMGSILGLGLSRDVLGDIHMEPGAAWFVCLASIADFIVSELAKVGRVGAKAERVAMAELPEVSPALTEKQVTVASLRLDALVAAAFNWPRSEAAEAILSGRVQLAHRECLNTSHAVRAGDILSVRGTGRVKLLAISGETRKGRQRVVLGYY